MQKIAERTVGHRTITNTEWPIVRQIQKDGRKWIVVDVCNGIGTVRGTYRTRAAAREAFEA